jgi:hypothetical protein
MTDTIINVIGARHKRNDKIIRSYVRRGGKREDVEGQIQSDRRTLLAILAEVSEEIKREPSSASIEIQAILERK